MPRVQTPEYQQKVAALQAVAAPTIQQEQFSADPNSSGAFQLARALGAADFNPVMKKLEEDDKQKQIDAATAYANSRPVADLAKDIKDGVILPSQSPVYVATVQNIAGENSMKAIENDVTSKLSSGALSFKTPEELDKHLTTLRNDHLAGQSRYAMAGFDKGWNKMRDGLSAANIKMQDKAYTEYGVAAVSDSLTNTATSTEGTPQARAQNFISLYSTLRDTGPLMTPEAGKAALRSSLVAAANTGDKEMVDALLASKLDNGLSVSAVIGNDHAVSLSNHADQKSRQAGVQRVDTEVRPFVMSADRGELDMKAFDSYVAKNEKFINTSTYHSIVSANQRALERIQQVNAEYGRVAAMQDSVTAAKSNIQVALSTGTLSQLPQQKVLNKAGGTVDLNQIEVAQEVLAEQTKEMSPEERLAVYSRNDVPDPELKKRMLGGLSNIATIGWKHDGKNVGELSPVGQQSFEEFVRVNKVNPGYTQELVGSKAYETLSLIEGEYTMGGSGSLKEAARVVNEAANSGITKEDFDKNYKTGINSAVDKIINPGMFSSTAGWVHGFFGNDVPNLTPIHSMVRKMVELRVRGGMEANRATEDVVKYLADPARSTKINNVIYPNMALPRVPEGEDVAKWMERYKEEIPQKVSKDMRVDGKNIILQPQTTGNFIAMNGTLPVYDQNGRTIEFTKEDFSNWVNDSMKADRYKKISELNKQADVVQAQKDQSAAASKQAGAQFTNPQNIPTKSGPGSRAFNKQEKANKFMAGVQPITQ